MPSDDISLKDAVDRVLEHVKERQAAHYQLAEEDFFRAMNCELGLCHRALPGMDTEEEQKRRREEAAPWAARHLKMQLLQALVSGLNEIKAGKL